MKYLFAIVLAFSFSMTACSDETCSGGNCLCDEGGSCDFDCGIGGCSQKCTADASCTFTCEGGVLNNVPQRLTHVISRVTAEAAPNNACLLTAPQLVPAMVAPLVVTEC